MTERVSAQTLETETKKTFMFSKHQFKIGVIYFMKTKKLLSMALAVGMSGCMVIGCGSKGSGASDDLIVYHAARWMGAGWSRSVRFGYVDFDEDGRLKPIPVTSGEDLEKIPSGEPQVSVYGADQFALSGDVELCGDSEAAYAAGMISTEDIVEVTIDAKEEQDASVTVFVKTDDLLEGVVSGLEARLNGEAKSQEIYAGENYQPLYFSFHLEKGENVLVLRSDIGGSELKISRVEIRERK